MLNERQDEFAGWAGKLEEPGALSGQGLADKDASWEKLHDRLRPAQTPVQMQPSATPATESRRKRAIVWFWLSAAAVLIIIIIGVTLMKPASVRPAPRRLAPTAPSSEIVRVIPNTRVQIRVAPARRHAARPITRPVQIVPEVADTSLNEVAVAEPPAEVTLPAKKELRIVSINEISDTMPPPSPAMAQKQYKKHPFTIGFGSGPIRPATATHSNSSKTSLTISLSSQNP